MGEDRTDRPSRDLDRLTVAQAADALGISQDAVRKRIARRTISHDRDESGRVYVYLAPSETVYKTDQDTSQPQPDATALTSELRDRLRYVEGQLEAERQAHAEARRLLMAALERIPPQLEAPPEKREPPESPGQSLRRAYRGPGGVGFSGADKRGRRAWLT